MASETSKKGQCGMAGGRPSKWKDEYCKQATNLCLLGATNEDLARAFEVAHSTVELWMKDKPEFSGAVKKGRELADAYVAKRLYSRATGYSHPEDKIFNNNGIPMVVPTVKHYAPDTTAAIFWLKNRQPDKWRDVNRTEMTGKDGGPIEIDTNRESVLSKIETMVARAEDDDDFGMTD